MTDAGARGPGPHPFRDGLALRLVLLGVAAYLVHAAVAVGAHRALYGDAAWFLVRIMSEGDVTSFYSDFAREFYYSRFVAFGATQLPTVLALRLGVDDPVVLSWILGATYFAHKPLSLALGYRLLPPGKKLYVVFPLLAVFAGTINSELYIVTETHLAVSLLWPLLIALALGRGDSRAYFAGCGAALLVAGFVYESFAFFSLFTLAVVLARLLAAPPAERTRWVGLAVAACVPLALGWAAILFPRDPTNKSAFTGGMLKLVGDTLQGPAAWHAAVLASLLALGAVGLLLLRRGALPRAALAAAGLLAAVLALGPAVHFVAWSGNVDFTHAITDRGVGGLALQLVLVVMFLFASRPGAAAFARHALPVASIVSALAIGQVAWQLFATASWAHALGAVTDALERESGLVQCAAALGSVDAAPLGARPDDVLCHWWVLPISVVFAPGQRANALIDATDAFKPFDPRSPAELPSTRYAPVDFSPYLAGLDRDTGIRFGDALSFTARGRGIGLLRGGFSRPEDWATWTDGPEAVLAVCLAGPPAAVRLTFLVSPFLTDTRPALGVAVATAGWTLADWRFARDEAAVVSRSVTLPATAMDASGCTELRFRFDDARPASTLGSQNDPRRLGLAFVRMTAEPGLP